MVNPISATLLLEY